MVPSTTVHRIEINSMNDPKIGLHVRSLNKRWGGIEDVGLGLIWDATTLDDEVNRRAAVP
jgi:hypothetical protein